MTFAFRRARAEDLDRLVAIHAAAYPDARRHDDRVRNFTANAMGTLDDLWVAMSGDALVGHAFLFSLEVWFGGRPVPVGGIASVGVAVEARGRGVASAMLDHLHGVALARGDALTLLYPFRQAFYARLGYGAASPAHRLRFSPHAIPGCATGAAELAVRAASGHDRDALAGLWEAAGRAGTGRIVRTERLWTARLATEDLSWLVADGPDGTEGYAAWSLTQPEAEGETTLVVREMATRSDRAARSLWAAAAAMRHQVQHVEVETAAFDPIAWALVDADRARAGPSPIGSVVAGPMLRATDLPRALSARGWPRDGALAFEVDGARWNLSARAGTATLAPGPTGRGEPSIRADTRTFVSIAFGGVRASDAARWGALEAQGPQTLEAADAILALPAYFSPERF
jgi:predicted acetyltransferase